MIARFPEFSKLDISHKDIVQGITSQYDPYSDFNFTSLFCWNTDSSAEIALLNGNLVIKLPDYLTGEPVISLLGNEQIDESLQSLLANTPVLKLVPQIVVDQVSDSALFMLEEDRDNFDYIYIADQIAHLPGGVLKKKRNKVSTVTKALAEKLSVTNTNHIDDHTKHALQELFKEWAKYPNAKNPQRDVEAREGSAEQQAINRLLDYADHFNLLLTTVSVDGKLAAFSLNEMVNESYAICHFEKALPVHGQIYSFIANQAAKDLLSQGCEYINWEQDLGISGLRMSKTQYHPVSFLKKYTVRLK